MKLDQRRGRPSARPIVCPSVRPVVRASDRPAVRAFARPSVSASARLGAEDGPWVARGWPVVVFKLSIISRPLFKHLKINAEKIDISTEGVETSKNQ